MKDGFDSAGSDWKGMDEGSDGFDSAGSDLIRNDEVSGSETVAAV
jgi:hypothetical protein